MESPKAAQSRFSSQQFLFLLSSFTGISSFRVQIRLVYKVVREWRRYSIDVTSEGGSREGKFSRNFVIAVGRTGFSDCANRCLPGCILLQLRFSLPFLPLARFSRRRVQFLARWRRTVVRACPNSHTRSFVSVYQTTRRFRHYRIMANGRVMCTEAAVAALGEHGAAWNSTEATRSTMSSP